MKIRKISPKYWNIAEMELLDNNDSWIKLTLGFDKWHEISTKENEDRFGTRGGSLDDIILIAGKDIQADLIYHGEIQCIDNEDISSHTFQSYPPENSLFHSGNLVVVEKGHYRFTTKYMPTGKTGIIDLSRELIKEERSELLSKLKSIFDKVRKSGNYVHTEEGHYDFNKLNEEYKKTGKFSGDCKAISTFTAGIIESHGLKTRIVDGTIHLGNPDIVNLKGKDIEIYQMGHVWTEAYIPHDNERGFWVPVDPSLDTFLLFPNEPDRYSLGRIKLPSFKDQSIETAKIKLQYV